MEPLESISNWHSSAFPPSRRPGLGCGNRLSLTGQPAALPAAAGPLAGGRRELSAQNPQDSHAQFLASAPCGSALTGHCQPGRRGRALKSTTDTQQPARSPGCRQSRCAAPPELSLGYHLCRVRCRLLRSGRVALGLPCGQREGGIAAGRQAEGRKEGGRAD